MKILILCTGNSCRSQMGELLMQSYDKRLDVVSAGTTPSSEVHPKAITVLSELGFDLTQNKTKSVNDFLNHNFDYLITVCGGANETCPVFLGEIKHRVHIGFDDPAEVEGSDEFILSEFRRIRNEINTDFRAFYDKQIKLHL